MRTLRLIGAATLASLVSVREAAPAPRVHTAPGEVQSCVVAASGRVLAGGKGGLIAWSGGRTDVLTAADGLPGTDVRVVIEGPRQRGAISFWIGTNRGVALLRWAEGRVSVERAVEGPPVNALLRAHDRLWVGTWGAGLMTMDTAGVLEPVASEPARIASLALAGSDVYVGTADAGLWRMTGDTAVPVSPGADSPFVWSIAEWGGRIYAGTMTGLVVQERDRVVRLLDADVRVLRPAGRELLVGTAGDGLRVLRQGESEVADAQLGEGMVFGADRRDGTTCAATPAGLYVRQGAAPWSRVRWPGLASSDVTALAVDARGGVLVGTFDGGVVERLDGAWSDPASPIDRRVNVVASEERAGARHSWVGTAQGLFRIEEGSVRRFGVDDGLPSDEIHALALLEGGGLMVGTARGVATVTGDRVDAIGGERGGPGRHAVWALAVEPDGTHWVGTSRGLYWRSRPGAWRRESVASGRLPDDWVTALAIEGDRVWVGTYAGGVARLRRMKGAVVGSDPMGGGNVNPAGLTLAGGVLYAATMDGLRWRRVGESGPWQVVPGAAPGRDVTAVASSGGALWVASRHGLAEWPDGSLLLGATRAR